MLPIKIILITRAQTQVTILPQTPITIRVTILETTKDHQETTKDHPETIKDHPETIKDHPETIKDHPKTTKDHPEITKGHLKTTKGHPEITKGHLKTTRDHPEITIQIKPPPNLLATRLQQNSQNLLEKMENVKEKASWVTKKVVSNSTGANKTKMAVLPAMNLIVQLEQLGTIKH
jgi:hypothetical protein